MNPDAQRELIPRDYTLHVIGALNDLKAKLLATAEKCQLLDDTGRVPAAPSYAELLQHAADAQALSADVVRMTAEFARSTHSTNRIGSAVLAHLATAATMSSHAAPYFAETAESALCLPRSSSPTDRQYRENRMVIDHATARAYLRRTSESLRDAANELDAHLDFHRFFPAPARQQSPATPPPRPTTRHR
ncbi:hypothetical protein CG747_36385 [Streptomyces sp. CB02959]|uniref:hypothetical protein n=1 Tax=Streptomyces sp. CB02959 TaxID=2020330 RepID=UPI000C27F37E|nr:hypothetical protein [Streptomyces sp. CB02959]PJN35886.1 hypothetical protein CG747_36385 [Streptomyces sp. CB02959]